MWKGERGDPRGDNDVQQRCPPSWQHRVVHVSGDGPVNIQRHGYEASRSAIGDIRVCGSEAVGVVEDDRPRHEPASVLRRPDCDRDHHRIELFQIAWELPQHGSCIVYPEILELVQQWLQKRGQFRHRDSRRCDRADGEAGVGAKAKAHCARVNDGGRPGEVGGDGFEECFLADAFVGPG